MSAEPTTERLDDGRLAWIGEQAPDRHEPFQPGNDTALVHGAYSERSIAERAEQVHAALLEVAPWCAEDRYAPSVHRYLQATAREQLAHEAIMSDGNLSPRLLEAATAAARLAWAMADQLGLTPAGHARLKVLVADATSAEASLADLAATGAAIRARRQAALDQTADQLAGPGAIRSMAIAFSRAGVTDRTERLARTARIIGRTVTTSKDLTAHEASAVLDALEGEQP